MFWTGFSVGFASCLGLVICDHWYASYRAERRARADFLASLTQDQQKQLLSFEGMGDWRQFRDLVEIEKTRQLQEVPRQVGSG
jgi:hypothetical protein